MKTFKQFVENSDLNDMAKKAKIDIKDLIPKELKMGYEVEKEHDGSMGKDTDVVNKPSDYLKIAVAHLREDPKYYTKLKKVENE
ncbi:MAG: DUF5661 family protein [Candidatus Thorarchaeota archaeon]|jgi:hypothetical protein